MQFSVERNGMLCFKAREYKMVDVSLTENLPFLTFTNFKFLFETRLLSTNMIFLRPKNVQSQDSFDFLPIPDQNIIILLHGCNDKYRVPSAQRVPSLLSS